jgi:hypothetical protein
MALKMAEMTAFLNKRQTEDDHVQQLIQDVFKELNKYIIIALCQDQLCVHLSREVSGDNLTSRHKILIFGH